MKIFKTMVLAVVMAAVCGGVAQADSLVVDGEVAAINTIAFSADHNLAADVNTAISAVTIGTIQIDNNDPQGFTVTLTSENSGQLVRYDGTSAYYTAATEGNAVDYTLQFFPNASPGTLGAAAAAGFESTNLTLAVSPGTNYDFSTSVVQATVARLYDVKMTRLAAPDLFNSTQGDDVYQDTLTVTIANL